MIKLIITVDEDYGIAKDDLIPWAFKEDLRFFREKTIGSVVVMGRKTFFSIPQAPLDRRINCVLSRSQCLNCSISGAEVMESLDHVMQKYTDFWIIGGLQVYRSALEMNIVNYALITKVNRNFGADKRLPPELFSGFIQNAITHGKSNDPRIKEYSILELRR
jgi:dihydrofolate reductase